MHKSKFSLRRAGCCLLAAAMLAVTAAPAVDADYKTDWEQAEAELKAEQKKYNDLKKQKTKAEQQKQSLQNQESIIKGQIRDVVDRLNEKISEIAIKEQAVADQQAEIDLRWDDFQSRMQAMQKMHEAGAVAMIASADSLYELLTFSNALQTISRKDNQVLDDMQLQKQKLEEEKAELEAAKAEMELAQQNLTSKQNQLAANIQQQNQNISEKDAAAKAQAEVVAESQRKADEAEAQYEAWIKANSSSGSGQSSEGFIWPVAVRGRVTTEFGETQNINGVISPGHKGMDIACAKGTPIYAAHNGTVYSTSGHWSYGNVVMIDNGDGVTTLYAHMSSKAVSVGQQVTQGQVIGYVGSTGNSTGNHLHFEVRVNGVRKNPRDYVTQP